MSGRSDLVLGELVELLADALAPRVAELLAPTLLAASPEPQPSPRLVSIDELVELLPPGRSWRRWIYEHAPRGDIPGAVKVANRWFFRLDETMPWLEGRSETSAGLDVAGHGAYDRHGPG